MSDGGFFREVDEAVRQERYRALWQRYGTYCIVAAVLLILSVAGYKGWLYWQQQRADKAGAEFAQAVEFSEGANASKAAPILQQLAKSGPGGYPALARFELAANDARAGKTAKAVAEYESIAADGDIDPIFRDDATIQAAALRLPKAAYDEMERRLSGLIQQDTAWKYSARELLGLSAYRLKDMDTAKRQFDALLADSGTPTNLRERASMMLALIMGMPEKAAKSGAGAKTD